MCYHYYLFVLIMFTPLSDTKNTLLLLVWFFIENTYITMQVTQKTFLQDLHFRIYIKLKRLFLSSGLYIKNSQNIHCSIALQVLIVEEQRERLWNSS